MLFEYWIKDSFHSAFGGDKLNYSDSFGIKIECVTISLVDLFFAHNIIYHSAAFPISACLRIASNEFK